jgi:hypothetical protein
MLPVVELDLQPSAAMLQESYYLLKATSLFIQQNLPEILRREFAGGALMALPVGTVRPACSLLWAYLAEWCDVMVFFGAPKRCRVAKMAIEGDRHRPRNAQLRQGEGMSPSLMGLTHLVWGMRLIFTVHLLADPSSVENRKTGSIFESPRKSWLSGIWAREREDPDCARHRDHDSGSSKICGNFTTKVSFK